MIIKQILINMSLKRPKEFEVPVDEETKTHHGLDKDMLPPSSDEENEDEFDENHS